MDTQTLRAFLTVAECQSFTEAAELMHLTQPAISKRLSNLEQQLEHRLFDRIGRKVSLTEAGEALLPQARAILLAMANAERSVRDLDGSVGGKLSMGISHHIGLHRLPPVLRYFTRTYPEVRLDIDFMDSEQAHDMILHGELDLAVITLSPEQEPNLESFAVWEDPLTVATALDHPLASRKAVTLRELQQHTAIPPGLNTYTGQIIKRLFDEAGLKMDIAMSTNYMETIKVMVSIGLGWSILPATLIDDSVEALTLKGHQLSRTLGCVHHRNRSLSNAAEAFIKVLKEHPERSTP
ncbi:LysR family transcriptional regulator [Litorivivens sp.]|uniref:LysR family transcriptional regulator n=1 Tax=Litorivivens sp. TaxID=2020868 RepID=UPI003562B42B